MAKSTAKQPGTVAALDFISHPEKYPPSGVCAVFGDDAYLKSEVIVALRRTVLGAEDGEFSFRTFIGKETLLREVLDALATVSLFAGGQRMVVVEEADTFVTEYRSQLEDYAARPASGGQLVLEVKTWQTNTRLAKIAAAHGLAIDCKTPAERQLKTWIAQRAKAVHHVRLDAAAVDALFELVPPEPGILVQEIAKLALIAGENGAIDVNMVRENTGGWRVRVIWDIVDAAADGRAADALAQLHRLILSGEKPQGLFPQIASALRPFGSAIQLVEAADYRRQRLPLRNALSQAGMQPFKLDRAERQLKQIGRSRAKQLTRWLLAADLAIKGNNSSDDDARIELERLIVKLSAHDPPGRPPNSRQSPALAR